MEKSETRPNLPWVEKYRPSSLQDLVSHESIIKTITKFVKDDQVPHLLFYGPPGTGKTSTILACARQLYSPGQFSSMVLELNASDDRGIGIVRGQVLTFASTRTIFKSGFKLIILDEADAMTMEAQNALRRSMSDSEEDSVVAQLNAVFVGEANVGKTSLIRRFCFDDFTRQYNQTVGADFYIRRLLLPGRQEITVRITDVGGLELQGHMLPNYLFKADLVFLIYDITNSSSFDILSQWMDRIKALAPICAVIGNKSDLEHQRAVRLDNTRHFVRDCKLFNCLVSAKTGDAVNSTLINLIAKHLGVSLTRVEKDHQETVVKAELIPADPVIEKYTENVRFCIICNYLSKIIPALQSRCTRFRFGPLSSEQILPRLNYVIDEEKLSVSKDGKEALLTLAKGDMRKVLNVLQSTSLAYTEVTEENVYTCVGHPMKRDIQNIVKWLLNENFQTCYKNIKELKMLKGLALNDIITEVHTFVQRIEFPFEILTPLLHNLAEIEFRLINGTSENIQLTALISAFYKARDL